MGNTSFYIVLCLSFFTSFTLAKSVNDFTTPYLSPTIFFPNYQKMLKNFKIFIYARQNPFSSNSPLEYLFYNSLQNGPFVTQDPNKAHLFFVAFPSDHSTRAIARVVRDLRMELPYWNRTLGADHFYVSCNGIGYESDRNLVELKKNSVQLSCFPSTADKFIPHKDTTLPPLVNSHDAQQAPRIHNTSSRYLGYVGNGAVRYSTLVKELTVDPDFVVDSEPRDSIAYVERLSSSKFCLFDYDGADMFGIGEAMRFGCVPGVITNRPIQDLPLMDVLRWQDMAVFVGSRGGLKEVKRGLDITWWEERRRLGVTASQHFVWNETPQPYDAFHMVMYQLWLRRHTIRYARREWNS